MARDPSLQAHSQQFSKRLNDKNGYEKSNMLCIAVPGPVANTVVKSAYWPAKSYGEFGKSIVATGIRLIKKLS